MRPFNGPEYLHAWASNGEWPAIHTPMAEFAMIYMRGSVLLDLGCSFGLLGARISEEAGGAIRAVGIDADERVIAASQAAKVPIAITHMRVTRETLPDLTAFLAEAQPDTIIARRVLPELWGEDLDGGREFASVIAAAGVREVLIEGRVVSERATNPLRSVADEVALLSAEYRETTRSKALSRLVLR